MRSGLKTWLGPWLSLLACIALLGAPSLLHAQGTAQVLPGGCGTAGYGSTSSVKVLTQDSTGKLCSSGGSSGGGGGSAGVTLTLLNNATTSGSPVTATVGGGYYLNATGTFGGATETVTQTINGVTTNVASFSSAPTPTCYTVGAGTVLQANLAGGSPTAMTTTLNGVGACPTTASGANIGATGSTVPSSANLIGGGAAGGAGNLTGATVKAASTAPVASDTALVVANSPNSAPLQTTIIPSGGTQVMGNATTTGTGATTLLADPGAGVVNNWQALYCWNSSASTVTETLNDTNGTQLINPAGAGNNIVLPTGMASPMAAHTALTFTASGSATTNGCTVIGYKK